jgi:hypothetical protein
MKHISNSRGAVSVLLVVLIVALVAVVGTAAYNVAKPHHLAQATPIPSATPKSAYTPAPTPTRGPVSASDLADIQAAASTQCNASAKTSYGATLDNSPYIVDDSAQVGVHCTGYIGGHIDWFKRINGTWTFVYAGQNMPSKAIGEKYSLPTSWYQSN